MIDDINSDFAETVFDDFAEDVAFGGKTFKALITRDRDRNSKGAGGGVMALASLTLQKNDFPELPKFDEVFSFDSKTWAVQEITYHDQHVIKVELKRKQGRGLG